MDHRHPLALYSFFIAPNPEDSRSAGSSNPGPFTSEHDQTGRKGVYGQVKYVPVASAAKLDAIASQRELLLSLVQRFERIMTDCVDLPDTSSSQSFLADLAREVRDTLQSMEK